MTDTQIAENADPGYAHISCPDDQEIMLVQGRTKIFGDGRAIPRLRLRILNDATIVTVEVDPATLIGSALHFATEKAIEDMVRSLGGDLPEQVADGDGAGVEADTAPPKTDWVSEITCTAGGKIEMRSGNSIFDSPPHRRMQLTIIADGKYVQAEVHPATLIMAALRFTDADHLQAVLQQMQDYHAERAESGYEQTAQPSETSEG